MQKGGRMLLPIFLPSSTLSDAVVTTCSTFCRIKLRDLFYHSTLGLFFGSAIENGAGAGLAQIHELLSFLITQQLNALLSMTMGGQDLPRRLSDGEGGQKMLSNNQKPSAWSALATSCLHHPQEAGVKFSHVSPAHHEQHSIDLGESAP